MSERIIIKSPEQSLEQADPSAKRPQYVTREHYSKTRALACVLAVSAIVCGVGLFFLIAKVESAHAQDVAEQLAQGGHYDPSINNGFLAEIPCVFGGLLLCVLGCCSFLACGQSITDLRGMQRIVDADALPLPLNDTLVRESRIPETVEQHEMLRSAQPQEELKVEELVRASKSSD